MPDPYLYKDTNILVNKFDIRDADKLAEVENDLVYLKLLDIESFFQCRKFNTITLKALHKHLFGDVYEWAGQYRTINIFKYERVLPGTSVQYSDYATLQTELRKAMDALKIVRWEDMIVLERASVFSRLFARLWKIHPFREGNTRTITTFMLAFAQSIGIQINGSLLAKYNAYVRESLVMASIGEYAEYQHLEKIILDAMNNGASAASESPKVQDAYQYINEHEVKDYYYRQFVTKD